MPMFDPATGKVLDRAALKSVALNVSNLKEPGTPGGPPVKVKDPQRG